MAPQTGEVRIRAWRPAVPGIREVLHASFAEHAYPPHTHDAWTLFIVDRGAIRYDLDGRRGGADPGTVGILPPTVVHDGRPASSLGYRKRVLYLEPSVLGERWIGPSVDRPAIADARLRSAIATLHRSLEHPEDALEAETRLAFVAERLTGWLGRGGSGRRAGRPGPSDGNDGNDGPSASDRDPSRRPDEDAERLRAYLDRHLFETVTMADAAAELGAPVTGLARSFAAVYAIAPHTYVIGRRLDAARERLLDGQPVADVATEVGFFDQAHLTHRFRRFLGTTPAAYRAAATEG
jgi:AraC-like DNA-binding protein